MELRKIYLIWDRKTDVDGKRLGLVGMAIRLQNFASRGWNLASAEPEYKITQMNYIGKCSFIKTRYKI